MPGANLTGANLSRANLLQTKEVDLTGANFSGAKLLQAVYVLRGPWWLRIVAWAKCVLVFW